MDVLTLSRLQFAITTLYHFIFVPLTLGLSIIVALMETIYVVSGRETYKEMARFWGKLLVLNFSLGVVTGIVLEFQFGMNWSEYARFVGDIFGAPLAIEGLMAFFLESTFLGVWIFGWDKVSRRVHVAAMWLVAFASNISGLWILIANSWMQEPVGYVIRNGRAEMTDFFALLLNPNLLVQFPHVFSVGLSTAAFFVLGISAWHLSRKSNVQLFQRSFSIAAVFAIIGVGLLVLNGHAQAQHVAEAQPMKIAAAEGLFETEKPASFSLLTIGDRAGRKEVFSIRLPYGLSLLACNQLDCEIKGINELQAESVRKFGPGDYVPPAWLIYWSFRVMVGAGFVMLALALIALFFTLGEMTDIRSSWLRPFPYAMVLPYGAAMSGWIMTEVGRTPWIVYGLMKVEQGVTPTLDTFSASITLVGFTLVYAILLVIGGRLFLKFARAGYVAAAGVPDAMAAAGPTR